MKIKEYVFKGSKSIWCKGGDMVFCKDCVYWTVDSPDGIFSESICKARNTYEEITTPITRYEKKVKIRCVDKNGSNNCDDFVLYVPKTWFNKYIWDPR